MTNNQKKFTQFIKKKSCKKKKVMSSLTKKKKKRGRQRPQGSTKRKEKKRKKKRGNWMLAHGHFCTLSNLIFFFQFSLQFGQKTFWWTQGKNTWALPFIFLPIHQTKHTPKSFISYFLFKVFHLPYFIPNKRTKV